VPIGALWESNGGGRLLAALELGVVVVVVVSEAVGVARERCPVVQELARLFWFEPVGVAGETESTPEPMEAEHIAPAD
jgi:hypothetical protein